MTPAQRAQILQAIACAIAIAGGQAALARKVSEYFAQHGNPLKIGATAVNQWLARRVVLDEKYWPAIEHVTAMIVTRRNLRPDLFGGAADPEPQITIEASHAARQLIHHYAGRAA